jgi:hypothetical protein
VPKITLVGFKYLLSTLIIVGSIRWNGGLLVSNAKNIPDICGKRP